MEKTPVSRDGARCIDGFPPLLRVGELEGLRRLNAALSIDTDGGAVLRLERPRPKTDRRNEWLVKVPNGPNHPLAPVRGFPRRWGIQRVVRPGDTTVFNRKVRMSLSQS